MRSLHRPHEAKTHSEQHTCTQTTLWFNRRYLTELILSNAPKYLKPQHTGHHVWATSHLSDRRLGEILTLTLLYLTLVNNHRTTFPQSAYTQADSLYVKGKERKSIYIAPFCTKVQTKRSGTDHTVLSVNNTMPAFPSWRSPDVTTTATEAADIQLQLSTHLLTPKG